MSNKLIKHMAIAHSGIYAYRREELPSLGVYSVPSEYGSQAVFNVYRPATLMAAKASLFTRLPVTLEHPERLLNPSTVKDATVGFTGDSTEPVFNKQLGEVFLVSSMTLTTDEAIAAYDSEIREVSPGYSPVLAWQSGVHNGEDYQLVMTDIKDVNHLAITRKARGGAATCIFDSIEGGGIMKGKYLTGLWRFLSKKAKGAVDTDLGAARNILTEIAAGRATFSDEEISGKIAEVQQMANDLPESEDRGMLMRLLEDFKQSKQMDDVAVKEAAEMISTLFEKLDTSAMAEVTKVIPTETPSPSEAPAEIVEAVPLEGEKPVAEVEKAATTDGEPGAIMLTDPNAYVPGAVTTVGQDACSDADLQGMLAGLKGKKITPDQAMYILQEILSAGKDSPVAVSDAPMPVEKPVEEIKTTEKVKPAEDPKPIEEEKPKEEEETHAADSSVTATLDSTGDKPSEGLKEFFGKNFNIK